MAAGIDLLKGATAAAVDSSHVSVQADANDGLQKVLSTGTAFPLDEFTVQVDMTDVSTASSAFAAAPHAGVLQRVRTVLHSAISGADANLTAEFNGTAVDGFAIVVAQSGSAAGDVIELISDGASSTAARLTASFVFKRTEL